MDAHKCSCSCEECKDERRKNREQWDIGAKQRRDELAERMSHSTEIGRTSSPDSFELNTSICGSGGIASSSSANSERRNLPAMRSDVRWYIGKHGAG